MTMEQDVVRPYEHPDPGMPETELHAFRTKQLAQRAREASATLDLLTAINQGRAPPNIWPGGGREGESVIAGLKGRLDLSRAAAIGHSFGAATSLMAASKDPRFHSVTAMDPWMYPLPSAFLHGPAAPLLVVNSETFHWAANLRALQRVVQHKQVAWAMMVTLRGTGHMDQSDFTCAFPSYITLWFRSGLTSDPTAVLRSNNDLILAFLQQKAHIALPSGASTVALPHANSIPEEKERFEAAHNCRVDFYAQN